MKECSRFVSLYTLIIICASFYTVAKMPDNDFNALRMQVSAANKSSPLAGITKVDELLALHTESLAPSQHIRLLYLKSWYQINADRIKEAMATLAKTRLLATKIKEPGILYSYYSISASAFSNVELYELALENNLKAYDIAPVLNRPEFIHQTENNIGHIYLKLGLIDEAETYFKRFYDSAVKLNQPSQQATGLNNLGEAAFLKGDFNNAHLLHQKALTLRRKHNYEYHEAWSLYNLGRVYTKQALYIKAEHHLKLAIDKWHEQSAFSKALLPKLELANVLIQQKHFNQARLLIDEIIGAAKTFQLFTPLQKAQLLKSQLARQIGELNDAIIALDEYNLSAKNFANKQASIGLAYMISQTELHTKETALQQLEQQHQLTLTTAKAQRQRTWILLLSALIIILITSIFIYRLNKRKHQLQQLIIRLENTQEKLIESEKMRAMTTLVSGMAHQLNTPLGLVITANSTLQAQIKTLTHEFSEHKLTQSRMAEFIGGSTELLSLAQNNTEKAADLIQRFKMMSAKLQVSELTSFELIPFLRNTALELTTSQTPAIICNITGSDITITNYKSVLLKVIAQFIENSIKHGFTTASAPTIQIQVTNALDHYVTIHYKDNGIGITNTNRKQVFDPFYTTRLGEGSLGLGLNIIYNSVVHIMRGHVTCIEDSNGAYFVVNIPIDVQTASSHYSENSAQL